MSNNYTQIMRKEYGATTGENLKGDKWLIAPSPVYLTKNDFKIHLTRPKDNYWCFFSKGALKNFIQKNMSHAKNDENNV